MKTFIRPECPPRPDEDAGGARPRRQRARPALVLRPAAGRGPAPLSGAASRGRDLRSAAAASARALAEVRRCGPGTGPPDPDVLRDFVAAASRVAGAAEAVVAASRVLVPHPDPVIFLADVAFLEFLLEEFSSPGAAPAR